MTEEIQALEFAGGVIPGTEQYQLSCTVLNDNEFKRYGGTGHVLKFRFSTADRINDVPLGEAVEIFFSFKSELGTKQQSKIFPYSTEATEYDITDYLEAGENTITMVIRGRSTGLTRTVIATFTLVDIQLSSTFDISIPQEVGQGISVPYTVIGDGVKTIEFMLDGTLVLSATESASTAYRTQRLTNNLEAGVHTLQMKAKMNTSGGVFESELLFFSFVNTGYGLSLTTTLIQSVFPNNTPYFVGQNPGLQGEQYVDYLLRWAYFSTEIPNAVVTWKTKLNGVETVVGSREVDEKEGQVNVMPDPVEFQPDQIGTYDLLASVPGIQGNIGEYTITVVKNTAGLSEAVSGLEMKLSGLGRSNDEPVETKTDWSNNGFRTIMTNMDYSDLSGYTGKAVRFDGGATGINQNKPFATEKGTVRNGMAMEFDFMTRNIEDETIPLIEIGEIDRPATAYFAIYGKKVVLRPSTGDTLEYEFAAEERTHLGIVVYPNAGITDARMMFFILNGVQAPGMQYGTTAVFNIGSTEDTDDDYGMIHIGDSTGNAAIDIYGIRVYTNIISIWEGMNNFMIDAAENVGAMMKKNNIFINQNIETPNIDRIREQYRTFEVIGDLGKLEESKQKESFWGSAIYNDPFAPKFSFQRLDGRVFFETAGQSRLEDLMAKSFHADFNDDTAQATTDMDGNIKYKNRFVFAEGNIPENGVRIDLCGADSSISRNAAHLKMVNEYYPLIEVDGEYPLRTPAQRYALGGQWSADMAAKYGGAASDYPWPHNINVAPDSVPIVILWHRTASDPIKVYGIGTMMEEKKASYANGNHSIYLKPKMEDGTFDPYDRNIGQSGERGWDNEGTIEMEYVRGSAFTYSSSSSGWNAETREQSFELCFPKKKDLTDQEHEAVWQTFYDEFVKPLADTYQDQDAFDEAINDIIYMPSFCMYYNKVMDKKMNDSLCRNMHVLRGNFGTASNPKWLWYAKWWDADVQTGLFMSGAMGVPTDADRDTLDARGNYIMSGRDADGTSMWLWDALEENEEFVAYCKKIAEASHKAGWTCGNDKAAQDAYVDSFSEALYNLDGLQKYLNAFRKGNDYMIRMQGSSKPYRHGFLDASYNYREAKLAIGDYANRAVSFYAQGARYPDAAKVVAYAHTWFGMGLTTTNYVTGLEKSPDDGEFLITLPVQEGIGKDPLRIYGADKMAKCDISDFMGYIYGTVALGQLVNAHTLYIGRSHEQIEDEGFNAATDVAFGGLNVLVKLTELRIAGFLGVNTFDISAMTRLSKYYAAGTGLLNFEPASGAKFTKIELPDTIQVIRCSNNQLGDLSFWSTVNEGGEHYVEEMEICPTSLLTISLIGMGEDEGAKELVHSWLAMLRENPELINTAQITFRGINWTNVDIDDILTLASIPEAQRTLTGYIKCSEPYTTEQMNVMINAFGPNIFSLSNDLKFDCDSNNIVISASGEGVSVIEEDDKQIIEILQGTVANFTAVGFPIVSAGVQYRWIVYKGDDPYMGTESQPVIPFDQNTLNYITGVLNTTECSNADIDYMIHVDRTTGGEGTADIRVKARTYPNAVAVTLKESQSPVEVGDDGVITIINTGSYIFDADHTPTGYNGRMTEQNGGVWGLTGVSTDYVDRATEGYLEGRTPEDEFIMQVKTIPTDEVELILTYASHWRNGLDLTAQQKRIALMGILYNVLTSNSLTGNPALFGALEEAGLQHSDLYSYNSVELKRQTGTLTFAELLEHPENLENFRSGQYNVLQYLKSVTGFDCSYTGILGDQVFTGNRRLQSINLEGTNANAVPPIGSQLTQMKLGAPNKVIVAENNNLVPSLQWASEVKEVVETNSAQTNAFQILDSILRQQEEEALIPTKEMDIKVSDQYDGIGAGTVQFSGEGLYTATEPATINFKGTCKFPATDEMKVVEVKRIDYRLPGEYQEVEYLESTGTQWIDTGIIPEELDTYIISAKRKKQNSETICAFGVYNYVTFYGEYNSGEIEEFVGAGGTAQNIKSENYIIYPYSIYKKCTLSHTRLIDDAGREIQLSVGSTENPNLSVYIFARNKNNAPDNAFIGYIKEFEILGKCRLIPCYRKSDNKPGMYDTVMVYSTLIRGVESLCLVELIAYSLNLSPLILTRTRMLQKYLQHIRNMPVFLLIIQNFLNQKYLA